MTPNNNTECAGQTGRFNATTPEQINYVRYLTVRCHLRRENRCGGLDEYVDVSVPEGSSPDAICTAAFERLATATVLRWRAWYVAELERRP